MDNLATPLNAEISAIAHATEDTEKVTRAIKNILPSELRGEVSLREVRMMGHHKNPITSISAKISNRKVAEQMLEHIGPRLTSLDKDILRSQFASSIDDKSNFYLRFDKQAAYLGNLRLRQDDPIRIRIKFHGRSSALDNIKEYCRKVGLTE